ncbi:hypothetical protein ACQHIH_21855 (plasmid) [Xanthomonas sontii]|uniref:hypothetical protein n=1 Tax=Xanthomonas sontii TaxID=2650745 RepID=UPI003F84E6C0
MTTFRIDFDWRSAMPGRALRGSCYRFDKGTYFVTKAGTFSENDLPMLRRMIAAEGRRRGMQDISIRIKQVSHVAAAPVRNGAVQSGEADSH